MGHIHLSKLSNMSSAKHDDEQDNLSDQLDSLHLDQEDNLNTSIRGRIMKLVSDCKFVVKELSTRSKQVSEITDEIRDMLDYAWQNTDDDDDLKQEHDQTDATNNSIVSSNSQANGETIILDSENEEDEPEHERCRLSISNSSLINYKADTSFLQLHSSSSSLTIGNDNTDDSFFTSEIPTQKVIISTESLRETSSCGQQSKSAKPDRSRNRFFRATFEASTSQANSESNIRPNNSVNDPYAWPGDVEKEERQRVVTKNKALLKKDSKKDAKPKKTKGK